MCSSAPTLPTSTEHSKSHSNDIHRLLTNDSSLTTLKLSYLNTQTVFRETPFFELTKAICTNTFINKLKIIHFSLSHEDISSLSTALTNHTSITTLWINHT